MLHVQRPVPGWLECLAILPDGSQVKFTDGYENFAEVKRINSKLFTVHRMVRGEWQTYTGDVNSGWFNWEEAKRLARMWFNGFVDGTFRDKIEMHTDAVSWHNEVWADSQHLVERAELIAASRAAVAVWNDEYRPTFSHDIKLIIGEAAPGNGMPREIGALAIDSGNIVGYHPYEWWRRGVRSDAGERSWTSMRFNRMEKEWGLAPEWAFTESGPLEGAVTGWRSKECLDGNEDLYEKAVELWLRDVMQTNAAKQDRIRGFALFTTFTPNDGKWGSFHTEQPMLNRLAKMVAREWKPGSEVIVNPPVDNSEFKKLAWNETVKKQVTGYGGLRLNSKAAIQEAVTKENKIYPMRQLQIVTDETPIQGKTTQAVESLTGDVPRRVYVWEAGKPVTFFEDPNG